MGGELNSDRSQIGEEERSLGLGIMGPGIDSQSFRLVPCLHIYLYSTSSPFAPRRRPALIAWALTHMKLQDMGELSGEK